MEKHNVAVWSSDTTEGLETMIRDFFNDPYTKILNVSHSTCWDHEKKYVVFSVAVAYSYVDNPDEQGPPEGNI
ncbi:hypothetical protein [Flavisolibacter nicotianae]|uniref:hypothetical protein n=1 Tax=Flavisolibacter nicotianae TaxID=2364882 RepID=UPI000EAFEF4D|nr:hypothetical protein [Flavisolibacter nicotianae]